MSLEISVREITAGLASVRVNERKKNAETLKEFLTRNAVPSLLSENTLKKKGYTWNDLFDDINDYILKETEKFETSKNFESVICPLCTSLLHLCVAGSNKGQAFIKCDKITEACLTVLKEKRLTKAIGDAYLNLLYKYVLSYDHYLCYITPSTWVDLLDVSISACISNYSKLDDFTKLRLVFLVIKSARNHCQFVIPLRDSLLNLKKCFFKLMNDKRVQEVLVEIMLLLLEMLSPENRLTMCEFTEDVLSCILKFYDQNLDQKKKPPLFSLLQMTVNLHHPQGKFQNEEGSLASDWSIWIKHLNSILEIVCLEIVYLQKSRKQNEMSLKYCEQYFQLAASVYFQIFNILLNSDDNVEASSSKRQKVTFNKNKTFRDLINELRENHIPWFGIIQVYIKKYGSSVTMEENLLLVNIIESLITNNSSNFCWDILKEFTCLIVENLSLNSRKQDECDHAMLSLWNSCVRNSSSVKGAHQALHAVMQHMLKFNKLHYQNVQPLIKLYFEKGIPVTDESVMTLNHIFQIFYDKCSHKLVRLECFAWLIEGQIISISINNLKELLLRLISNQNIILPKVSELKRGNNILYDTLFNSVENCMLFSEFEFDISKSLTEPNETLEYIDINTEVNKNIQEYFETCLSTFIEKLAKNDIKTRDFVKCVHVILAYVDILLMNHFIKYEQIKSVQLYCLLTKALKLMYEDITIKLRGNAQMSEKVALLQCLREILIADFNPLLNVELRQCIDEDFFHCAHTIVNSEVTVDEEDIYEKDEMENINSLRHNCILILAAYCKKRGNYRGQLLDLILEPKLYNYTSVWNIECALQCINLLIHAQVDDPPIELIFTLMQNMCKELFRNSKATLGILEILVRTIDLFWAHSSNMRRNCIIMVKGYLQRCELGYYPPYVAALIYESVARIILLNKRQDRDVYSTFKEALIKKCTGDIHSVRIYTCYLMRLFILDFTDEEIDSYLADLMDIFVIDVSEKKEEILKDELVNRTLTLLHNFYVFCQTKESLIHKIVTTVLQVQKDKSLDKHMVKKVLNKITNMLTSQDIDVYLNNNILSILYFWFLKQNSLNDLPIYLFCSGGIDIFFVKNMKWIISADALWREGGRIQECETLKKIKTKTGNSEEHLVETCFCNIMILCLPYIVGEKYGLDNVTMEKQSVFLRSLQNANKLFLVTRQLLENEKWSNLFVENMAELVLLIVLHLRDCKDAAATFQVNTPHCVEAFYYPKTTFSAILNYFGELIDGHIMTYLCENQPLVIFNILYKLWDNVLQERIFEFKVLALHAYVTTIENIPLGYTSDAFVCNFTCNSVTHAIKICKNNNEIRVLVETLRIILSRFLPDKVDVLKKTVSQALSVLIIKKEEGYETECSSLMQFLVVDMKEYLKESEDVIDFITSLSQGVFENVKCVTLVDFMEKLKTYNSNLTYPSYETLLNMKQFLKVNNGYVNCLCNNSKLQGFSEYCGTSVIHQIINSLSNVLKSTSCDKTIIEACNCLAEIGNYDLKTLVTVPPADTDKITNLRPILHLAMVVLKSLSSVLFDEDPTVTSKAMKTLNRLLQYREGKHVLGFVQVDEQIIKPFSSTSSNISAEFEICDEKFNSYRSLSYWIPKDDERHHQWLTRVTTAMLDIFSASSNYTHSLQDVCVAKPNICENILPSLVGLLLYHSSDAHIETISGQLNEFFKYIWDMSFEIEIDSSGYSVSRNKVLSIDCDHKSIVKYMLDIVNFVRLQKTHYSIRSRIDPLNYLNLEYDKVAWAATVADQYLTAIYYGELWAVSKNDGVPPSSPEVTTKLNGGENIQRILRKCFVAIGETEAVEGCGTAHLTREAEILKHLMTTGQHWDALLLHDIALPSGGGASPLLARGLVRSLYAAGMPHLALQYIISMPENDNLDDVKFDCLSYLGDWSTIVDTKNLEEKSKQVNCDLNSIIKAFRYACVKDCLNLQISDDSDTRLVKPLNRAKLAVSRLCKDLNMENCQNVYKVVAKLHLFSDIEDYFSVRCANMSICELLNRWQIDKLPSFRDFQHLESLISQRSLILEYAAKSYDNFLKEIVSLQIQYTELGVSNNRIQMAQRLLATAKKLQSSNEVTLAEAQISWAKGHKDIALSLLRNIVSKDDSSSQRDVNLTAVSLRQYGIWMAESKYDNARNIIDKYLKKSLEVMDSVDHMETRLKVYHDIAKFADAEYKQVVSYMSSSIFENKLKCMENMRDAACSLRSTQQSLTKDEKKALLTNDRFSALDEAEIANTKAEKERFLQLAMRYYLLSLKHSEANNLSVFRVISLWLENRSLRLDDGDGDSFEELLHAIPSRKFLTVLPQLAPRLTNDDAPFDHTLRMIIERCAKQHPHHTLPILFSLKNSDKDKQMLSSSEGRTSLSRRRTTCEPRVAAANTLVTQLASENSELAAIIAQMDKMCDAMISFANHVPDKERKDVRREIPAAELINKLGPLDAIPIPIDTIPIRNDCNYSHVTTIASFDKYYELVGGINCPKKVVCRGSDGNQRVLLIKGEDDLRQDAVMQQVFSLMNALLERNPVTSRDNLLIRTYKVVAMSRRSGVLEWCEGTTPLGAYLVGNTGAHARYRPQDISVNAARTMLNGCYAKKKSNAEKLAVFLKILQHFKPVFHYFFTEHYLDPVTWYERRLAYTKSVAASSMVGYIMGLGDRHVQNILIDKKTAEIIHIDFGIAFDQGKALPTPETVPFRLTQDMIAGFGSSGVEGIFRRCCEKTMQLLRDNQETLLTILEVLLCDPLYSWTVTSAQQNVAATHCMNSAIGGLAERALLSVSSKLSGAEGGAAGGVAVPGHVARLIHSATDTNNLCRLFPGWQPYL